MPGSPEPKIDFFFFRIYDIESAFMPLTAYKAAKSFLNITLEIDKTPKNGGKDMDMYPVENFDYDGLVAEMAAAGNDRMVSVLNEALGKIPEPKFKTEREYFWKALHNASRKNILVWLWLITVRPDIDTGKGRFTDPALTVDWPLPVITPNDEIIDKKAEGGSQPEQYPSKPTEENFRRQAEVFEEWFLTNAKPGDRCRNVAEYVQTFRGSGEAQMEAMMQLARYGLNALATSKGILWLLENYPPQKHELFLSRN